MIVNTRSWDVCSLCDRCDGGVWIFFEECIDPFTSLVIEWVVIVVAMVTDGDEPPDVYEECCEPVCEFLNESFDESVFTGKDGGALEEEENGTE